MKIADMIKDHNIRPTMLIIDDKWQKTYGDCLPDPKLFGLDYALPAMFLALLVPQCKERLYTLAAVLSALLSVILAMYDTGRWNVIIASVITSTIGALLVTHRDRNIDALRWKA